MTTYYGYGSPKYTDKVINVSTFCGIDTHNDESKLPLGYARYCHNVAIIGGKLKQSFGVGYAKIGTKTAPSSAVTGNYIINAFFYQRYNYQNKQRCDRLLVVYDNLKVYQADLVTCGPFSYTGIQLSSANVGFINYYHNGKDCVLIFDDNGMTYLYDGSVATSSSDMPYLTSLCVHNGKIYGTTTAFANKVCFSGTASPLEWSNASLGAGSIVFPDEGGSMRKIIPYKGSLYVFRDYAVYKLTTYADIKDYSLTKIFVGNRKIYANTAVICRDKLIFMTDDAFYSFDGDNFRVIWRDFYYLIADGTNASAVYYDGKYYLTAKLVNGGTTVGEDALCTVNNGILAINPDTLSAEVLRGADVKGFVPCFAENKTYLLTYNAITYHSMNMGMITEACKIFNTSVNKTWRSPLTNLDYIQGEKIIRKLHIATTAPLTVRLMLDDTVKEYLLDGSNKTQTVAVNVRCDNVCVELSTMADTFGISGFTLEYEVTERRKYGGN